MVRIAQTDDTLKKASDEVQYEVAMLGNTLQALLATNTWIDSHPQEHLVSNSLLHSFLIATRNLCHFLYSHKPQANDIIAEDFFDDSEEWRNARPKPLPEFDDGSFVSQISRRLLHLTYDRGEGTKPTWSNFHIAWELAKALEVFVRTAKPCRLSDQIVEDVASFVRALRRIVADYGSVDDVESVPLSTLWDKQDFWTHPQRANSDAGKPKS